MVNKLVYTPGADAVQQLEGWRESWFIFAAYALIVAVLFIFIFKEKKGDISGTEVKTAEELPDTEI